MLRIEYGIVLFLLLGLTGPAPTTAADSFTVLAYHDVRDEGIGESGIMTVDTRSLVAHFSWLREQGYRVVGLDDIVAANEGKRPLPEKAVLLTFDDGYESVYTRVYPLLQLFRYPAVIGVVGRWMEGGAGERVPYGNEEAPRERFLTWEQVKEMVGSGLVEVASHTYDLHRGLISNPQGNEQPAATAIAYDGKRGYETKEAHAERIARDLRKSIEGIERHTGRKPRALIWPYGNYDREGIVRARALGMKITFGLDSGPNAAADLSALHRLLIAHNASLSDLVWALRYAGPPRRIRVMQVDLDYIYDENPERQEANLGLLLDRVKALGVNTVYLQAFSDIDGNGAAEALYFPNRHLPMRADLFNRVSWQLQKRAGVQVYAWMPALAFEFKEDDPLSKLTVQRDAGGAPERPAGSVRLSPFHPRVREAIREIYEDLARQAQFSGLLFHDDVYLTDFEDASPEALDYYQTRWNLPGSIDQIRADPELFRRWSRNKTEYLIAWTQELENRVRTFRPEIKTARNLYAEVVLNPEAEDWFAQSLDRFLESYDYTAVMAMPYLEGAKNPERWLRGLVRRVGEIPGALDRTVFELQSVDWNIPSPVKGEILSKQMRLLQRNGGLNLGYYPDDFIKGEPKIPEVRRGISLNADPYRSPDETDKRIK